MATTLSTPLARYESLWTATVDVPTYPPLDRNLVTDVVIVGAGIAGMVAADRLRAYDPLVLEADGRAGGRVLSFERGDLALNLGAHMFPGPDSVIGELCRRFALERAHGVVVADIDASAARKIASETGGRLAVASERIGCIKAWDEVPEGSFVASDGAGQVWRGKLSAPPRRPRRAA